MKILFSERDSYKKGQYLMFRACTFVCHVDYSVLFQKCERTKEKKRCFWKSKWKIPPRAPTLLKDINHELSYMTNMLKWIMIQWDWKWLENSLQTFCRDSEDSEKFALCFECRECWGEGGRFHCSALLIVLFHHNNVHVITSDLLL